MTDLAPPPAVRPASPFALFAPHPAGLKLLFFTELWERFSYYGMRALLIFYLTKYLSFTDKEAYAIYGGYTALVYIGPMLGGLLADRLLGARRAVAFGGILIALGHFTLALGGPPAVTVADPSFGTEVIREGNTLQHLFLALALIVTGEGFFKSNISTLVGKLYAPGDRRRDAGFTLFYMGINLGAAAATILCAWLASRWGWGAGFGLAGIGMLVGLATFFWGLRGLGTLGEAPVPERLTRRLLGPLTYERAVYLSGIAAIGLAVLLVQTPAVVGSLLGFAGAASALGLVAYALLKLEPEARDRLLVALALSGFCIIFIALFEQAGSSLNLFTDRNVERHIFGTEIDAAQFQSLNPLFILLLAPFFSRLWPRLERQGHIIATPAKFALGLVLMGLGFALLVIGAAYTGQSGRIGVTWIVLTYFLHTAGELALQPIGLSMITKLSPPAMVGFVMGVWFMATAAGQYLAALIASAASVAVTPDGSFDRLKALHAYTGLFGMLALGAFMAALFLIAMNRALHRRMHGAD